MYINNNTSLLNSFSKLTKSKTAKSEMMGKLSSGKRINKAADDAAGLAISQSLTSQVRGMSVAERNIQDGMSMVQVADGALGEIEDALHKMKELSIECANGTLTDEDRALSDKEMQNLKKGIDDLVEQTNFNGIKLLNEDKSLTLQVRENPYQSYDLKLTNNSTKALGLDTLNVTTMTNASDALDKIDTALNKLNFNRVGIGASTGDLESMFADITNAEVNTTKSLSQIEDIDMAMAMMNSVKDNILLNSNSTMLASAKQSNQNVNTVLNQWLAK